MPAIADHRHRGVDYAANVLCVLSFMACGDGGAEAGKLLGLLGLPNSTTFAKRSFGLTERFLGPELLRLADEVVYEKNLTDEVRLVLGDKRDNNGVLLFDLWKDKRLTEELWPRVTASGDMGWQGKGSGNSYNSKSGDAIYVGSLTRKPIAWHVMGKGCSACNGWKRSVKERVVIHVHNMHADGSGLDRLVLWNHTVASSCTRDYTLTTRLWWNQLLLMMIHP